MGNLESILDIALLSSILMCVIGVFHYVSMAWSNTGPPDYCWNSKIGKLLLWLKVKEVPEGLRALHLNPPLPCFLQGLTTKPNVEFIEALWNRGAS